MLLFIFQNNFKLQAGSRIQKMKIFKHTLYYFIYYLANMAINADSTGEPKILFYRKGKPFYEFSNFYQSSFKLDGKEWICVEQYFQAMKFYIPESEDHMKYFAIINQTDSPMKMAILGRQKKVMRFGTKWLVNKKTYKVLVNDVVDHYAHIKMRSDWDAARMDIMLKALKAKFSQNSNLKDLLK